MTELSHSKLKYDWFKKAVSSTTYRLNIARIYVRNVPRVAVLTRLSDVFWIPRGQLSWSGKPSPVASAG